MRPFFLMPFGKHKGKPLHKLPQTYLHWLLSIDLDRYLKDGVERAIAGAVVYAFTQEAKIDAAKRDTLNRLRAAYPKPISDEGGL